MARENTNGPLVMMIRPGFSCKDKWRRTHLPFMVNESLPTRYSWLCEVSTELACLPNGIPPQIMNETGLSYLELVVGIVTLDFHHGHVSKGPHFRRGRRSRFHYGCRQKGETVNSTLKQEKVRLLFDCANIFKETVSQNSVEHENWVKGDCQETKIESAVPPETFEKPIKICLFCNCLATVHQSKGF